MNRTFRLLLLFLFLVAAIVMLLYLDGERGTNAQLHFKMDEPSRISQVLIGEEANKVRLVKQGTRWSLNDSLYLDQDMLKILLSVMEKMQIKRAIEAAELQEVLRLSGEPVSVFVSSEEGEVKRWKIAGNPQSLQTYLQFMGAWYEVYLPGYDSYLAGFFLMPTHKWESLRVYEGTPQSLFEIQVIAEDTLRMLPEKGELVLQGGAAYDTLATVKWLESAIHFQVKAWSDSAYAFGTPELSVHIADLNPTLGSKINLYRQDSLFFLQLNGKKWAEMEASDWQFWQGIRQSWKGNN
ncbi:hypothetical protein QWY31_05440 [Cytophagales bacterium LB-30]|uniref:DUF4340 domain-containing protein n=1 Tax=Shiella aurantiaca TaxID=3058365 RepID=A0ABT8F3W3_9BACT|nr:hypothetical protein [Shiella aurantiaca]MDN4164934.1 hypothetical protein [Shiella aurantiaca]